MAQAPEQNPAAPEGDAGKKWRVGIMAQTPERVVETQVTAIVKPMLRAMELEASGCHCSDLGSCGSNCPAQSTLTLTKRDLDYVRALRDGDVDNALRLHEMLESADSVVVSFTVKHVEVKK